MLAKSKLNSIETLVSQALIDMEISHEEFITILKEKDKYEKMKDNLRSENENYENKKLKNKKEKIIIKKKSFFSFVCIKWLILVLRNTQMLKFAV